ncbi:hypothetical protein GCM10010994_12000 [Chelatococcus reniformis]|uniref:Uncharacterized protein n=1 Tax=Chelatococcus reniformis TaxID=1494448 RepID=A0A916X9W3_9HYPH|nr:hypothetical protein GCM10010994_12000 [Chelatococcus reniformis]
MLAPRVVDRHDDDHVGKECAGRIEFLAVQHKSVASPAELGLVVHGRARPDFGEGVAEAVAIEHAPEVAPLLFRRTAEPQRLHHVEMVLGDLAEVCVRRRDDGDDLCERDVGDTGAAELLRHRDGPESALREAVEFGQRQAPLTVSLGRADAKFGGERAGRGDGGLVGADAQGGLASRRNMRRRPAPLGGRGLVPLAVEARHRRQSQG